MAYTKVGFTANTEAKASDMNQIETNIDNDLVAKDLVFETKNSAYTIQESDNCKVIHVTGNTTITLPNGLSQGFNCSIINDGTDTVTIVASTTLRSKEDANTITSQYSAATVYHAGSDIWYLYGDLE